MWNLNVEPHDSDTQPFWQSRLIDVALWSIHETSASIFKAVCLLTMGEQTKLWFMVMLYLTATLPWQNLGIGCFTQIIKVTGCFPLLLVARFHIRAKPYYRLTYIFHPLRSLSGVLCGYMKWAPVAQERNKQTNLDKVVCPSTCVLIWFIFADMLIKG